MSELAFGGAAAAGYDRAVGHSTAQSVPMLMQAARLAPGQRVLDIATGTGVAAEAAAAVVGPSGGIVAADLSADMIEQARHRLAGLPNVSVAIEDGQALSFADCSFDAVLCSMGLMYFPDPARGLAEFHRVLRHGGSAAVSVNTTPERSNVQRINLAIGRHVPALAEAAARLFALGDAARLRMLFEEAGFQDVEFATHTKRLAFPSFDAYFEPVERGGGATGQAYMSLPEPVRRTVREDVRRELGDTGGPLDIDVEIGVASGRRRTGA
ncbi:class I SAM-dependent methyltransferase [Falsiroseomonas oryzae]|uniref:class I SAM-dependent methyltransferase n=1 Tax=Falsiroseomonas oryzae TaxID=2766473 RepID=UPI0022EACA28|nr:methyltransferase domain-containing protein [Roseomonas sp. MO-31]